MASMESYDADHRAKGYGASEVGFGMQPAVVVVDFQRAFTDPGSPTGGSPLIQAAVRNTAKVLEVARGKKVPIIYTVVAFRPDGLDFGLWKITSMRAITRGSNWAEVDEAVKPHEGDMVLTKTAPSAFFGTDLLRILVQHRVDTVILAGCTTSGCVRASIIDSFSHGFRTIVMEDCVGDQGPAPHQANLADCRNRYCDVVDSDQVLVYLETLA